MKSIYYAFLALFLFTLSACDQTASDHPKTSKSAYVSKELGSQPINHVINFNKVTIPDKPASGKIMAQPFCPDEINISDTGELAFWTGNRFLPDIKKR